MALSVVKGWGLPSLIGELSIPLLETSSEVIIPWESKYGNSPSPSWGESPLKGTISQAIAQG